ncbi:MAG: 1-(5-phosphoribosyl)-5-[(5-phosphoribosylamino)methylideneamino]imidazole-4-carboxamide isomerase [Planctomycetia bacterium]|nr:1-(5-phosphoribosyl)-5-[(5-phosphoribosylamino)methylideneamino]imidazole-4-carboxamide isomerase [Planctomycetia bacterium]
MQVWPAIDLRDGKCVRLQQGDYGRETVFGPDPADMARRFVREGARQLHVVDLDGAREGRPLNRASIAAIVQASGVPCQVGGGIRSEETIDDLILNVGAARLVVGTKALREPNWFRAMCRKHPQKLALGIDARKGMVATEGWLETSHTPATELATHLASEPIAAIVYTDIESDGMLAGPNLDALAEMIAAVPLPVIASGGVTTKEDVERIAKLGAAGCIVGRALYEGRITMAEALAAAGENDGGNKID